MQHQQQRGGLALALWLALGGAVLAETAIGVPPGDPGYAALCAEHAIRCEAHYTDPQPLDAAPPERAAPPLPAGGPQLGPVAVIGAVALALILWLRFAGGNILARAPRDGAPPVVPQGWDTETAPEALDGLDTATDRGRALLTLLRRCLLAAAQASATRLARSDTERAAFERLPQALAGRPALERLLHAAELAHYGGRAVPDDDFAALLAQGRGFMRAQRAL